MTTSELNTQQLRLMAEKYPEETAFKNLGDGSTLTFRAWEQQSNRLARGLVARGVAPGERVALYVDMAEACAWVTAYVAAHKAGAVAVPVNTRHTAAELVDVLRDCGSRVLVVSAGWLGVAEEAATQLPELRTIVSTSSDSEDAGSWPAVLDEDPSHIQVEMDFDAIADLMYTSGTTGRPKGVVVRHRSLAFLPNQLPNWSGLASMNSAPLFTTSGIMFVYSTMKLGMTALFLPRFDPGRWLELVEAERPAMAFIVPAMAQLLVADPRFDTADLSSLQMLSIGSAPASPELIRRMQDRLPDAHVTFGYGMTEFGAATAVPVEGAREHPGSVGQPLAGVEVRIVDDQGSELPAGHTGEILLRASGRQREYFRDPEASSQLWRDGWLYSGDLGYFDADGFLYVVGRKKDVIIRGGHNIQPAEVERALFSHPAVIDVAVAGVPHDVLGEDVVAWVVLGGERPVDAEELREFCLQQISDYKTPRRIVVVDELPRNAAGKVVKRELMTLS